MGYTHYYTSQGDKLNDKQIANINKLIDNAKSEFDLDIFQHHTANQQGDFGKAIVTPEQIFFNHPAQETFALELTSDHLNFTKTLGTQDFAQEADMLTTSILLYLESEDVITYSNDGLTRDRDNKAINVDSRITDAAVFAYHVLGDDFTEPLERIVRRMLGKEIDSDTSIIIEPGYLNYDNARTPTLTNPFSPAALLDAAQLKNKKNNVCGFFMPRAKRMCILSANHSGGHK